MKINTKGCVVGDKWYQVELDYGKSPLLMETEWEIMLIDRKTSILIARRLTHPLRWLPLKTFHLKSCDHSMYEGFGKNLRSAYIMLAGQLEKLAQETNEEVDRYDKAGSACRTKIDILT